MLCNHALFIAQVSGVWPRGVSQQCYKNTMAEKSEESLNDHLEFVAPSNSIVKKKHQIQGKFNCVFVEEPPEQQLLATNRICDMPVHLKHLHLVDCCISSYCS